MVVMGAPIGAPPCLSCDVCSISAVLCMQCRIWDNTAVQDLTQRVGTGTTSVHAFTQLRLAMAVGRRRAAARLPAYHAVRWPVAVFVIEEV